MYPSEPKQKNNNKWLAVAAVVLVLSIAGLVYDNWDGAAVEASSSESALPKPVSPAQANRSEAAVVEQRKIPLVAAPTPTPASAALPSNTPQDAEVNEWYAQAQAHMRNDEWDKAFPLWEKAAVKGHARALNNLAAAYLEGRGVNKDIERGCQLMEQAANKGASVATWSNLGMCIEDLPSPDYEKAAAAYQKAAHGGMGDAQMALGRMYAIGRGVPQETSFALYWMGMAAGNRYPNALRRLGECFSQRGCSKQYYDPAIGYALQQAAFERSEKSRSILKPFHQWRLRSKALSGLSERDKKYAEEYRAEWSELDDKQLVEAALLESGAVKPR